MPYIKSMNRNELMITSLDMLVESDSIVRVIDAFVDTLNLQDLGFTLTTPSSTGRPAYDPAVLLKLYIYGYKNAIRSSRKLQRECHINLEVRWLLRCLEPDFRTIADFRKNNCDAISKVSHEFNKFFSSYLLKGFVSIDGSKFLASNSQNSNFTLSKLDDRISWLNNHCDEYLRQMDQIDSDEELSGQFTKEELERKLDEAKERLEKYEGYRKYMEENNLSQLSLTDADSKLMKTRNGFSVAHNVQTVVDSETHTVISANVTSNPTDYGELYDTLKTIRESMPEDKILEVVADKGYQSQADMAKCLENGIIPHVIPDDKQDGYFVRDPERNIVICPAGNMLRQNQVTKQDFIRYINKLACKKCPYKDKCHNNKKGFKEIDFRKDEFVKPNNQWLKKEGKKSDIKSRNRKSVLKKVVTVIFRPNREKMAQRMCISEHPFGTIKRTQAIYSFSDSLPMA